MDPATMAALGSAASGMLSSTGAPAGPSGAGSSGDVSVGGLTLNKRPDWPLMVGVAVLAGVVVWVAVKR